ncbi:Bug family tripartite tricarboxylate transporter substrate binding protein [Salipiger sp.]|uniref:Bug family tripartite tricarboxylate transporter substrate binding protein n=1 Tax=Salipiger sp. TaxID=2078585 RepID=UPI003A9863E7
MTKFAKVAALCGLIALPGLAAAQDYPSDTVTIVNPSSPGGGNDLVSRILSDALSKVWDQNIVVENKPGAGGAVSYGYVANATPDGHTILEGSMTFAMQAALNTDLPFDLMEKLPRVAMLGTSDIVVVTGTRNPIKTLDDLVRLSGETELFVGATGAESASELNARFVQEALGVTWKTVTYKSGAEAVVDLLGGRIDVWVASVPSNTAAIESGATPIMVLGDERSDLLPEVPTLAEAGYPDSTLSFWWGLFLPQGTPETVIDAVNEATVTAMNSPEAVEALARIGAKPSSMTAKEFDQQVTKEIATWKRLAGK